MADFHGRMMNIQPADMSENSDKFRGTYKIGHRDARHAAAEIALEADAEIERLTRIAAAAVARAEADRVTMWMIGDVLHVDGPDLAARVTVAGRSMTVAEMIAAHERAVDDLKMAGALREEVGPILWLDWKQMLNASPAETRDKWLGRVRAARALCLASTPAPPAPTETEGA